MQRPFPKQLLPWPPTGDTPMVAAAFDAVSPLCDAMIVVLDHGLAEIVAALGNRVFETVRGDGDAPMLESVRAGLSAARARAADRHAAVLLHPADHPEVAAETLEALHVAHASEPRRAIIPEHRGRGGHPVIIPIALIDTVLRGAGDGGLRRFWRDHPEHCVRVEVDDPSILRDVDQPDDYGDGDSPVP